MKTARIVLFALLAAPGTAQATDTTIVSRELTTGGARTTAAVRIPAPFDLVGLHWQGSGRVVFRTRGVSGRWSPWREAAPEAEDLPDVDSAERRLRRGWRLGSPWWTGPSDRIEWRTAGTVRRVRAWFVGSSAVHVPARTVSAAESPAIVPRLGWKADEKARRGRPRYAPLLRLAIVHHTAGRNDYAPQESAAVVRAIALYHVKANGWQDIGYNFLVDRFGQVFEGRYGGMERNVIGAHAEGFNTGSVGIAVLGDYRGGKALPAAAERALARLLAWRLDVAHTDPVSTATWIPRGSARFPAGTPVFLRAVSGHRDTGFTVCPGKGVYSRLDPIAAQAAAIGLPKLTAPAARGALGGPIRFTARLSTALAWSVTVSSEGRVVAVGSGSGTAIEWTWDSAPAAPGRYEWTIEAGPSVRPARGRIGSPSLPPETPFVLRGLVVTPELVSPNGDGYGDAAGISYDLGARAWVTADVSDEYGALVATIFRGQKQSARRISFTWRPDSLMDGRYVLTVSAVTEDGRTGTAQASLLVDRTLGSLVAWPAVFSPNGDGIADTITFSFVLQRRAEVKVEVAQSGIPLGLVFQGPLEPGPHSFAWDGTTTTGRAPNGRYEVVVTAAGEITTVTQSTLFEVSSPPP